MKRFRRNTKRKYWRGLEAAYFWTLSPVPKYWIPIEEEEISCAVGAVQHSHMVIFKKYKIQNTKYKIQAKAGVINKLVPWSNIKMMTSSVVKFFLGMFNKINRASVCWIGLTQFTREYQLVVKRACSQCLTRPKYKMTVLSFLLSHIHKVFWSEIFALYL